MNAGEHPDFNFVIQVKILPVLEYTPLLYIGLTEGAGDPTGGTRFMNLLPIVTKNQKKRSAFGHGPLC